MKKAQQKSSTLQCFNFIEFSLNSLILFKIKHRIFCKMIIYSKFIKIKKGQARIERMPSWSLIKNCSTFLFAEMKLLSFWINFFAIQFFSNIFNWNWKFLDLLLVYNDQIKENNLIFIAIDFCRANKKTFAGIFLLQRERYLDCRQNEKIIFYL